MDDVINVSGHRLGTAEVEDVLDEHPLVAEAAVVGYPHEVKGEGVYAYITLKENAVSSEEELQKLKAELRASVKKNITSFAVPDYLQVMEC
jgi:acetyl-CoA synthetase